ncbi:MAG TPA: alpha/beta hydrolase [Chthonomonadaceae bacterium]|nr:alpha/beta hydrolase [Chthonomonadaceae bacterium]
MRLEAVTIPGKASDLAGLRYIPEDGRRATALVLAHGFTSGKYSMDSLASYLATRGFETLTFDFVGHKLGCSGGTMETMAQAAGNVADALSWLRDVTQAEKIVLAGHSMGAAAALATAAWDIAERATPELIGKQDAREVRGAPLAGVISICMGAEPSSAFDTNIGRAMLEQRKDYVSGAPPLDLLREVDGLAANTTGLGDLPALFIAAKQDVLLTVDRVLQLAQRAPNSSVQVIESSHLEAPDRARAAVYTWLCQL